MSEDSESEANTQSISTQGKKRRLQTSLTDYVLRPISLTKQEKINKLILNVIIKDLQPFLIIEDDGFKSLINELEPAYTMPSRKTFTQSLLPQTYNLVEEKLKLLLQNTKFISLTTDAWTSYTNDSYIATTGHFIDEKTWYLHSILFECVKYEESHTSINLLHKMEEVTRKWQIFNKIVAVTTDNAANIKRCIELSNWTHISCLAHTLNLIVQSGLKEITDIKIKIQKIVEYFHRSTTAQLRFNTTQKQLNRDSPILKLKNDVVTRWNSTFHMFERILLLKESLTATIGIINAKLTPLTEDEWSTVDKLCKVLRPFHQLTVELSSERSVSVSKILVLINGLNSTLLKLKFDHEEDELCAQLIN